ncbi:MAG: ATP-dependent DNA helicase RecG [Phycisphaerae bacterium]|nr:ATP-dependent DNA helicase RecG [Phycisphaerae bacterium]
MAGHSSSQPPSVNLDTPVRFIPGVGPARGQVLEQSGISDVGALLLRRPRRYVAIPACRPIAEWSPGQTACIAGEIVRLRFARAGRVQAEIVDGQERCRITWFHSPYLRERLRSGQVLLAWGIIRAGESGAEMINPRFRTAESAEQLELPTTTSWQAVYARIDTLTGRAIYQIIRRGLALLPALADIWPANDQPAGEWMSLDEALRGVHQPQDDAHAEHCRRRLAYDELLMWQLSFAEARRRQQHSSAPPLPVSAEIDRRIRARFPFRLSPAQDRAVQEISADLAQSQPMLRLLQGDVGSGKTAVAVYAALVAIANRQQVVLLAPTEILARQHYQRISEYLRGSQVQLALFTGTLRTTEREPLQQQLVTGHLNLAVGTHALLEEVIRFQRLGLVIIDEQHRFGVAQREALKRKAPHAHYLVLSATPIPRTLAMIGLGDLDQSVIDELPAGRLPVISRLVTPAGAAAAWRAIVTELAAGRQAYIVFPLIEESEQSPLRAVTVEYERLRAGVLRNFSCGLLHGRLPTEERTATLEQFRSGALQVLVATTVVEVGVDVANATVMAVFHAERYGLAQLHQLRGRVGRGRHGGQFFMFVDKESTETAARLQIMLETTDGFRIAEADLAQRGPGDLLGTQQHGLPGLRFIDLARDRVLWEQARQQAQVLLEQIVHWPAEQRDRFRHWQKRYVDRRSDWLQIG